MSTSLSRQEIEQLWQSFKTKDGAEGEEVTHEGLRRALQSLGHQPTEEELRHILWDANAKGSVTFGKFVAIVSSLRGDLASRLRVAFDVFDENGDGLITADDLRHVLCHFELTDPELKQIFDEADLNGDGALDFSEFCSLLPRELKPEVRGYRDAHISFAGKKRGKANPKTNTRTMPSSITTGHGNLKVGERPHYHHESGRGTSRLQMQISLFRLLQGAAYRSFREITAPTMKRIYVQKNSLTQLLIS